MPSSQPSAAKSAIESYSTAIRCPCGYTETLAFLAVNEASIRQYGFSREEFAAMTTKDIRGQDELPRLLENIAQQSGAFQSAEI